MISRLLLLTLCTAVLVFSAASDVFAAFAPGTNDLSLTNFQEKPVDYSQWMILAGFAVISVAGIVVSGGTASPAVTAVGSWIGGIAGYSGAAATSYGLALMGGGSLAAGGGGAALGTIVIASILSVGGDVGGKLAKLTYDELKAQSEVTVEVPGLPYPSDAKNDIRIQQSIDLLAAAYGFKDRRPDLHADYHKRVYRIALDMLDVPTTTARSGIQFGRLHSTRAIIRYNLRDYHGAALDAQRAMTSAMGLFSLDRQNVASVGKILELLAKAETRKVRIGTPVSVWLLSRAAAGKLRTARALEIFEAVARTEEAHDWLPMIVFPLADLVSQNQPETSVDTIMQLHQIALDIGISDDIRAQLEAIIAVRALIGLESTRRAAARDLCNWHETARSNPASPQSLYTQAQQANLAAAQATKFLKGHHRGLLWDGSQFDMAERMENRRRKYKQSLGALATIAAAPGDATDQRKTFCKATIK